MSRGSAEVLKNTQHLPREDQIRSPTLTRRHLNILPTDSTAPAGLQRFQRRFFCREARCIMLWRHDAARVAVLALSAREDTLGKARRAQEHFANSCNFDNVYTNGNDHERRSAKRSRILLARDRRCPRSHLRST